MSKREFFINIEGEADDFEIAWKLRTSKGEEAPTYRDFAEAAGMLLGLFFNKFQAEEEIGGAMQACDFFRIMGLVMQTARRVKEEDDLGGWDFGTFEA